MSLGGSGERSPVDSERWLHSRVHLEAKEVLTIEQPSHLPEELFQRDAASPSLLASGAREVVAALEAARTRAIDEVPGFAFDALLDRCREVSARLPSTPGEVDALIDSAGLQARTLRIAMNRLRERTTKARR